MRLKILVMGLVLTATGPTMASEPACRPPADLKPYPFTAPPPEEVTSGVKIATYVLSINWTPEWCRTNGRGITAQHMECKRPFGFTLHGLWPNGVGKPYPRYCTPVGQLPASIVRRMYCRTPSPELLQHEWQAHGGCGWTDPDKFFALGAKLYDRIAMPKVEDIAPQALTAGAVRRAFVGENPWLRPEMIYVQTDRDDRLTEVRVCYDLNFRPRPCIGGNGTADSVGLKLTPSLTRAF